jgi:3-oxoacyl-(acyl-carrier-protein) synthase
MAKTSWEIKEIWDFIEPGKRDRVIALLHRAVCEATLAGFDEAYKITAKSNTSEEAYSRLQKKRTELEGKA